MANETAPANEPKTKSEAAAPPGEFATDYSSLSAMYTNFCRVVMTPEELVLDFGLNPNLAPQSTEPVRLTHRVVMSFFTAKRLLNALAAVITQHEAGYGALELDFQKRVRQ
jgi:hypothetical protein